MFYVSPGTTPVSVATALAYIGRFPKSKLLVTDTSENITKNLDNLQKIANNVTTLTLSDSGTPLSITANQLRKDATILGKLGSSNYSLNVLDVAAANVASVASNASVTNITVTDTSAAIASALTTLAGESKVTAITQKGEMAPLAITAAQLVSNKAGLDKITGGYTVAVSGATATEAVSYASNDKVKSVAIMDSSANVASKLDALKDLGLRIKEIRTSDSTAMAVTADQVKNDALVLGKIYSSYQLAVANASSLDVGVLSTNDKVVSVDIVDTGANVIKNLALYKKLGTDLNSIQITDASTPVSITADQWALNESIVSKFKTGYSLAVVDASAGQVQALMANSKVASLSVKDTAANIALNLADLAANVAKIDSIIQKGTAAPLTMTDTQYTSAGVTAALAKVQGNYSLSITGVDVGAARTKADGNARIVGMTLTGTAANVVSNLIDLNALGQKVISITQSDSTTTPLALTRDQWLMQTPVLDKLVGGYKATVSGVTADQAAAIAADGHVSTVQIADTGANIQARLDDLQDLGAQISGIAQSDAGALTITASQLTANAGVLTKFGNGKPSLIVTEVAAANVAGLVGNAKITAMRVEDSAYNIAANLDALQTNKLKIDTITQTGAATPIAITYAQVNSAADALAKISGSYSLSVSGVAAGDASTLAGNNKVVAMAVTGDNATLVANLSALHGLGKKVTTITQSNTGTALALTGDQWVGQASTLNKIVGGFSATLSGVDAAKAQSVAADSRVKSLQVKDTAANLSANIDALQALGAPLTEIEQSDGAALTLTATQWGSVQGALGKYKTGTAPTVVVSQVAAANALSIANDNRVTLVKVSDNAGNVSANLAALQTVATLASPKLGSINLTGGSLLGMTHLQRTQSGAALAKIVGNYSLALTGATAAQAIALSTDAKVASVAVTDSAGTISVNINDLHSLGKKLQSINFTVSGVPLGLTYAQWIGKATTLNKITGGFTATVSAVAAARAGGVLSDNRVASVQVKDTRANINNQLAALQGLGLQVSGIEQTDVGRLSMTESQWRAYTATLGKVSTSTAIQTSQATAELNVTQALISSLTALGIDGRVKTVGITDSAANVSTSWDAIKTNTLVATAGSSISLLAGSTTPLKLTATQVGASTSTLAKIANGSYSLQVSEAGASDAQTLASNSKVVGIDVLDTAANVQTAFTGLSGNAKLTGINLSDAGSSMTLSQAQVLTGTSTLAKVKDLYSLNVTGVTMANVANLMSTLPIATLAISDTSDSVALAAFDTLNSLGAKLASVSLTDASTDAIEMSFGQYQAGTSTLAKFGGNYHLAVYDVTADSATALGADTQVDLIHVHDTANNVALNLADLHALGAKLDNITLTADEPIQITQAQATAYRTTLAKVFVLGGVDIDIV